MTRDPRKTPEAGDVLEINQSRYEVLKVSATEVMIDTTNRRHHRGVRVIKRALWEGFAKGCVVK